MLPNPADITLAEWIAYTNEVKPLDQQLQELQEIEDCQRKTILLTKNYVDRCFATAKFFGVPEMSVNDTVADYQALCGQIDAIEQMENIISIEELAFGQFVDAKMILQGGKDRNKWELLRYVWVIFTSDFYKPEYLNEESDWFKNSADIDLIDAIGLSKWWDKLNETINATHTVFQESGEEQGENMKQHMERWGWINFLKSIASTKVFDISGSGMNSIDCARAAKLDDVLTWASEEKDYNIALSRDMKKV